MSRPIQMAVDGRRGSRTSSISGGSPLTATPPGTSVPTSTVTRDPARGIPPCQGCHGVEARGTAVDKGPYLVYPVLRGQYSPYLVSRLTNFRMGLPHDTTSDFIMSNVARTLDDDSLQAIAAWLSSLPPTKSL